VAHRKHQRSGLAYLARIRERLLGVPPRGLGIAKDPQDPRPIGQDCHPYVLAKPCPQRTMLGRIIKRERAIEMQSAFRDVSSNQQGHAHEAMSHHLRNRHSLFLGERQEMGREISTDIAIECAKLATQKL
jgi:hypothetical protein